MSLFKWALISILNCNLRFNFRRSNSLVYPSNQVITKSGLLQFILKYSQPSVRIQTMLAFCKRECIERSLAKSYTHRQSLARAIRHHIHADALNKFEIYKIKRKLTSTPGKETSRLKTRQNQLLKYDSFLRSFLRRLRRIERKQSLLSYFLLKRIDQFRKYSSSDSALDPQMSELGHELYDSVYGRSSREEKLADSKKVGKMKPPKLKSTVPAPSRLKNVPRRVIKDEL